MVKQQGTMLVEQEIRIRAYEIDSPAGLQCFGTQKDGFFILREKRQIRCPEKLMEAYRREYEKAVSV